MENWFLNSRVKMILKQSYCHLTKLTEWNISICSLLSNWIREILSHFFRSFLVMEYHLWTVPNIFLCILEFQHEHTSKRDICLVGSIEVYVEDHCHFIICWYHPERFFLTIVNLTFQVIVNFASCSDEESQLTLFELFEASPNRSSQKSEFERRDMLSNFISLAL